MITLKKIAHEEIGLKFRNNRLVAVLTPGWHVALWLRGERIEALSEKALFLAHPEQEQILRSDLLQEYVETVQLEDDERALLWVDGRFAQVLTPGRYGIFKRLRAIRLERLTVTDPAFRHPQAFRIAAAPGSERALTRVQVEQEETGLLFRDGRLAGELEPGFHVFWKDVAALRFVKIDLRERQLDMAGQEIITADKVTLRMNAVITWRVADARRSVQVAEAVDQALYREGQLILRAAVGARTLDAILADKESLTTGILEPLQGKAEKLGLAIVSFGLKDLVLPGDIRELMNRVVAAQKEAEANQIVRREETAATRSQCNTAKMLEQNPVLMRLRELEVLERIAEKSKLNLVVGDKGLTERLTHLL